MRLYVTRENIVLPFKLLLNTEESDIPLGAEVSEATETIPGMDGEFQVDSRFEPGLHTLVLRSWPDITGAEKDALVAQMQTFWAGAKSTPQQLHYERTRRTYTVKAVGRPERPQEYASWIEFVLPLKAHDPHGYADGESYMAGFGLCDNKGNVATPARIEFAGPVNAPSLVAAGVQYRYSETVPAGTVLRVDAKDSTALLRNLNTGAESNANLQWNGNFLTLPPGYTSVTAVSAPASACRIFWKNRWG